MQKRSSIIAGLLLILVGLFFLAMQMFPTLAEGLNIARQWPLVIIGLGGLFMLSAVLGAPPLAIPGSIIGGVGGLLYYQNATGNWGSWAYAWTLIIGFVGVGLVIFGLLERRERPAIKAGAGLIAMSLFLFAVFALFFTGFAQAGLVWPIAIMLLGVWLLLRGRRRGKGG